MIILNKQEIEDRLDFGRAVDAIEACYRAASAGEIELPPVGHITFPEHVADCHIKFGHRRGADFFVIKVATGFPHNDSTESPINNGLSLVMSAETGAAVAVLHDEMLLTDIRTGIGGAIASQTLAKKDATRLLIVGTGAQARHQIHAHNKLFDRSLEVQVWGRSTGKAEAVAEDFDNCIAVTDLAAAATAADMIVTVTAARDPLVQRDWVLPGTHITAVGADAPGKHELESSLIKLADVVVADSRSQCLDHGELSVVSDGGTVIELGEVLAGTADGRTDAQQITIADLTGIAAQDIAIASVVLD